MNRKTQIINKRTFNNNAIESITFLGYKIILENVNNFIKFNFGISTEKIGKYQNKFNLIIEYTV